MMVMMMLLLLKMMTILIMTGTTTTTTTTRHRVYRTPKIRKTQLPLWWRAYFSVFRKDASDKAVWRFAWEALLEKVNVLLLCPCWVCFLRIVPWASSHVHSGFGIALLRCVGLGA